MDRVSKLLASLTPLNAVAAGEMLGWWLAGVDAVEPRRLVRDVLGRGIGEISRMTTEARSVVVLAVGKAAAAMAWGVDDVLDKRVDTGLVIADVGCRGPRWAEVMVGGHPVPTAASVDAARAAIRLVDATTEDQLLLALVSGGGSALMEAPHEAIELTDVQEVVDQLIRSGAPIETINQIRSSLSQVKGGRLAGRCAGSVATLVLSDVLGSDPSQVASGPTVAPNPGSGFIQENFELFNIAGPQADRILTFVASGESAAPPVASYPVAVVGNGRLAGEAAVELISRSGFSASYVNERLDGDACEAACEAIGRTRPGEVGVFTGETTVLVSGSGRGGRNQHAALAAALEIGGSDIRFLAGGTDGVDGPTDAAGALVDGATVIDVAAARRHLTACDAYPFLGEAGALIHTGPTGTNVGDLWIVDKRH